MTVSELGITAQSTYLEIDGLEIMPFSDSEAGGGLRAAIESVQTMLVDFGVPRVAGKTHAEILSMSGPRRQRWYKRITLEEKAQAIQIVRTEGITEETRKKLSENAKGNQYAKGHKHTEETKEKISKALTKRVKRVCPVCGKIDYVTPYDAKTKKYCSSKCGHTKSGCRSEKIEWSCGHCGKVEYLIPYYARTKKYCSQKCTGLASRSNHSVERRAIRNSTEWRIIRKKRMLQFCNVCPVTLKTGKLHVHHIDFDFTNHDIDNLIPLWTPYHTLVHARAGFDPFYEYLDHAVLSSIVRFWNEEVFDVTRAEESRRSGL